MFLILILDHCSAVGVGCRVLVSSQAVDEAGQHGLWPLI